MDKEIRTNLVSQVKWKKRVISGVEMVTCINKAVIIHVVKESLAIVILKGRVGQMNLIWSRLK